MFFYFCSGIYEAKEYVLFEGWFVSGNDTVHFNGITIYLKSGTIAIQQSDGIGYGIIKTIQDLVSYGLILTPSALKQIGIE